MSLFNTKADSLLKDAESRTAAATSGMHLFITKLQEANEAFARAIKSHNEQITSLLQEKHKIQNEIDRREHATLSAHRAIELNKNQIQKVENFLNTI